MGKRSTTSDASASLACNNPLDRLLIHCRKPRNHKAELEAMVAPYLSQRPSGPRNLMKIALCYDRRGRER
jgi:hypothetical protein